MGGTEGTQRTRRKEEVRTVNNKYEANTPKSNVSAMDLVVQLLEGVKKYGDFIPILACVCCCVLVIYTYRTYVPSYNATATFTISPSANTISSYSTVTPAQLEKTFPYIITSAPLTKAVTEDLGLGYMPGSVNVEAVPETNMFTITATSNDYQMSHKLLKSVINNFPDVAEYIVGDTEMVLVIPPSATSEPTNDVSYRTMALIGTGVGIAATLAIIFLLEMFNVTIKKPDDVEAILNCERLGSIIKIIKKKSSNTTNVVSIEGKHVDPRYKEAIYSIRNLIVKKCKAKSVNSLIAALT